ncbi:hypothetical protein ASPZODRAFT_74418 [Penicilliopsis zonata CBS 506.65]|uniref:ATP-dependent DNA helicase CHL1 n=1 Tax=Penicilliopsis zonata CBS 506.65 TaxID=1073090 RepID=A0A1L9S868_9EURO|nr:hypothetical protein ASPZODRAFT_74418 [Penicilliopsis zonata CBS 506.65]OJJ43354.1 hypothetical protein ASPZODRAFT_74418 [Penicilliopsis zonata CBS 506.65]
MDLEGETFHHPYSPYETQLQFMRALYTCLEEGKVAVFESPTGTGKSLSLICGSLTWLRDHKRRALQEAVDKTGGDDDDPDWMVEFAKRESSRAATEKIREFEKRLAKTRQAEERLRRGQESSQRPQKRQKVESESVDDTLQNESQFALDDYESDREERSGPLAEPEQFEGLSADTLALLERFKGKASAVTEAEDSDDQDVKIFYCSRTHSQLTQFAHELQRVTMSSSLPKDLIADALGEDTELAERIKHLSLGSRKNLCINPKVLALENPTAINERCLDLQKPGQSADKKCPYLPSKDTDAKILEFRDHTLASIKDIEDIGKVGKQLGICPYYASRSVIKNTEIVTLPYPLLLQRSAREALHLSLKNHIVIIDEAHNLMDAISNIYSAKVTLVQLQTAISQLTTYARKYQSRLKGKNRTYVAQVIRMVSSIAVYLKSIQEKKNPQEGTLQASDLMSGKGVDQINPYKLSQYLQESKLARKVDGYIEFSKQEPGHGSKERSHTPVLFHIQSFLLTLMNPSVEGRLFYHQLQGDVQLEYMLLDPTNHFREIVESARAVILAGGTMSPMSDYLNHLFSYVPKSRIDTFSYGHVIPSENLTAQSLVRGIQGSEFDFTFEARSSEKMIIDLGRTISALCEAIPDGVVAFFPSYDYLDHVMSVWKKPSTSEPGQSILSMLQKKKPVLYEPRGGTMKTEELLQEYSNAIETGSGALLLSVVGGKLSEGINFSDRLGRGVLMVGLPFPNIRSAVWQAKIQYVETRAYEQASGPEDARKQASKTAGREFYENACMRAVNQCIGRAIRHLNDYAVIVMIDKRYNSTRIQAKLPAWIRQSLVPGTPDRRTQAVVQDLSRFFAKRGAS